MRPFPRLIVAFTTLPRGPLLRRYRAPSGHPMEAPKLTRMTLSGPPCTYRLAPARIGDRDSQSSSPAAAVVRQRVKLRRWGACRLAPGTRHGPRPRSAEPSPDPGENRALASDLEEPHPARKLLSTRRPGGTSRCLCRLLQSPPLSREPEKPDACRRLLRKRANHPVREGAHQKENRRTKTIATCQVRRLNSNPERARASINNRTNLSQIFDDGHCKSNVICLSALPT